MATNNEDSAGGTPEPAEQLRWIFTKYSNNARIWYEYAPEINEEGRFGLELHARFYATGVGMLAIKAGKISQRTAVKMLDNKKEMG
jgi:hypothetical protein